MLVIVGVPLLFPDGRFLSPRWRWVAVLSSIVVLAAELRVLVGQQELVTEPGLQNPFYIEGFDPLFDLANTLESLAALPLFALAIWSLVQRYRRADDVGRHQIRWLAAISSVAVVAFGISFFVPPELNAVVEGFAILALNAIPVAIGIAVVRYRLYDIDRLISRGISYGLVTVVLLATYVAAVLILQGPLGQLFGTQTVTVAISTLVIAGLFQPVRSRIHRAVDRRFDRARIDTERTAAAFSDRLRDQVDITPSSATSRPQRPGRSGRAASPCGCARHRDVTVSRAAPRSHLVRAIVAWGIFGFALVVSIASLVTVEQSVLSLITYTAVPLTFGGIGAFLSTRVPGNPIGTILLVVGLGFAVMVGTWTWLPISVTGPTTEPFAILIGLLGTVLFIPTLVLVLVGVPLLFPDGQLVSPRGAGLPSPRRLWLR